MLFFKEIFVRKTNDTKISDLKTQTISIYSSPLFITHPPCLIPNSEPGFRGKISDEAAKATLLWQQSEFCEKATHLLIVCGVRGKSVFRKIGKLSSQFHLDLDNTCNIRACSVSCRINIEFFYAAWRSWTRKMIWTVSACSVSWATSRLAILIKGRVPVSMKRQQ